MTTGQSLSTNTFGVAKWVVSADATQGTHTTIAAAITSASSGDTIWVRDGTYIENLTLKAGVSIIGESISAVNIKGNHSFTLAGTAFFENLTLTSNAGTILTANTGGGPSAINCNNVIFIGADGNCWSITNASSSIIAVNCQYGCNSTFTLFVVSAGQILMDGMISIQAANSTLSSTASTANSGGVIEIRNSYLTNPLTITAALEAILDGTMFENSHQGATALTVAGATVMSSNCTYNSGSASSINISSGILNSYNDVVSSSNTNAVTGAGTINIFDPSYSGSSHLVNTTTTTGGVYSSNIGIAPAAGCVGERIVGTRVSGSPQTLSNGAATNMLASPISLTVGTWDISLVMAYSAGAFTATVVYAGISANSASFTGTVDGDSLITAPALMTAGTGQYLVIPTVRVVVTTTTSYYAIARCDFTVGTPSCYGRMSAVRAG